MQKSRTDAIFLIASGPLKISDNNIENIFNINIYINGVFSNNVASDVVNVLTSLLNHQSIAAGGANGQTLKDQLMDFVKRAESNDLNLNIPASELMPQAGQQNVNLDGLAKKIQDALTVQKGEGQDALLPSNLETKAKDILQQYLASNEKQNL